MNDPKKIFNIKGDDKRENYVYMLTNKEDLDYLVSLMKQRYDQ